VRFQPKEKHGATLAVIIRVAKDSQCRWGLTMGQDDAQYEGLGSVSIIDDWPSDLRRRLSIVGRLVVARRTTTATNGPNRAQPTGVAWSKGMVPLALVTAGAVALLLSVALGKLSAEAPAVRAALEMMMSLFALAGAWLLRAQFGHSRRLRDLLLLSAFLVLGLMNLWTAALPAALSLQRGAYFPSAALCGELVVGAIFAASSLASPRRLVTSSEHPIALTTLLGLIALVFAGLGGLLLAGLGGDATAGAASMPGAVTHPQLFILALGATGPLAYAATGFARRHQAEADRVAGLLAIALMLLAVVSLSHLATLSRSPGLIGPGEGLRVAGFALLLLAAATLEKGVRAQLARSAALAERHRVARDLHDGIVQDLALIAAHGPRIAQGMGDEHPVVVAARRALAISRSTISELSDPAGATTHEALEAVAQELRDRFHVAIAVDAQLDSDLPFHTREQVTRIAREAIVNAARHGQARNVVVSLRQAAGGVALRVLDDGCGIAGADGDAAREGFGLRSMRERAAALGGSVSVRPAGKAGTELEVVLP
jgi:signal transduction histidine kinase